MKKFYLSTKTERIKGIIFTLIMTAVLVVLLIALRNNLDILLFAAPCVALIVLIFAIYATSVSKAICYPDAENKKLRVGGFRERNLDLSKATCLETIPVKSGHVTSRSLAFSDAEGGIVAIVPTYFTSKNGILAEPMAKELAQELGLEFFESVPVWEYDEQARKAHEIEVEQQEKEESKARKEAKKAYREAKIRKKMEQMRSEDNTK